MPGSRVAGFGSTGDPTFASDDKRTAFVYVFPPRSDDPFAGNVDANRDLVRAMNGAKVAGAPVRVTGYDALSTPPAPATTGRACSWRPCSAESERWWCSSSCSAPSLAFVPLAMAICSVLVSFLLLWGLTAITDVSPIVQFLVALIGLGVSIDYALLIVVRWREEREKGSRTRTRCAPPWARPAVPWSSRARPSAVGLLALVALPLPFLRSMGYGGLLIPLVATLVAITLLPVILATIGPKLDRRRIRRRDRSNAFWQRWAETVVRRRGIAAFTALAILSRCSGQPRTSTWAPPTRTRSPRRAPPRRALDQLADSGIGKGAIAPTETLARAGRHRRGARPRARSRACTARWRRRARTGAGRATR